jgi:hypothetical protein
MLSEIDIVTGAPRYRAWSEDAPLLVIIIGGAA